MIQPTSGQPVLLTPQEAAEHAGVSIRTIRQSGTDSPSRRAQSLLTERPSSSPVRRIALASTSGYNAEGVSRSTRASLLAYAVNNSSLERSRPCSLAHGASTAAMPDSQSMSVP